MLLIYIILIRWQEIYAAANTKNRELDDHMESVMSFLHENRSFIYIYI